MNSSSTSVFFAYPSSPEMLAETQRLAADRIHTMLPDVATRTWEGLRGPGQIIIDSITGAIDAATVSAFEVTYLNSNVLFELGYAIGSNATIWTLRDPTRDDEANRKWDLVQILTTLRYRPYTSSEDIATTFVTDRPDYPEGVQTVFENSIEPFVQAPPGTPSIFYVQSLHNTDASRALSRRVNREQRGGFRIVGIDPNESTVQPLTWIARELFASTAVVIHLDATTRRDAEIHHARCALIGGIAFGMQKPLLMLAETDYSPPIDYRDLLYVYSRAQECVNRADEWMGSTLEAARTATRDSQERLATLRLSSELSGLRLGDHVAENEAGELWQYFIDTAPYREVLRDHSAVFVGRKGAGKTANMLRAAEELERDRRNLVVIVKPAGYELESLLRLLRKYSERDVRSFLVESLWKYLLYTEIARAALDEISRRPAGITPNTPGWDLHQYLNDKGSAAMLDFAVRLERTVDGLVALPAESTVEEDRTQIAEALHQDVLAELRQLLGRVLSDRERVAILVDNLDKAWDREADLTELSYLLLGLLSGAGRVADEFTKDARSRDSAPVTVAIFIRSDIYAYMRRVAREPDKIPTQRLTWQDREVLLRIIEERYAASREEASAGRELWERWFCQTVNGEATRTYIASRVLPRPRDIVYFCNAAIGVAVTKRHARIEQADVLDADREYSQFAFEAIQVENGIVLSELEDVLYEFVGAPPTMAQEEVAALLEKAGIDPTRHTELIDHLRALSFLGVETSDGEFDYSEESSEQRRADQLAEQLSRRRETSPARFEIHPAFRSYLEVREEAQ